MVTREEADVPNVHCWAAGALHVRPCDMSVELHAALRDLATCNAMRALRDHAMPFSPARPRDMQCHAHPMPCTPFLTFVKHSAHFLCMHAQEYSAPGVCLCAEIVSRWSAHQRLSGMVRVSVFPSLDTVCRVNPPLECSVCSRELPMCVRGHMRMGVCGYACACAREFSSTSSP